MRKFNIISLGLVIIIMGILIYIFAFLNKEDSLVAEPSHVSLNTPSSPFGKEGQEGDFKTLPTQSNKEGGLSIDVTPLSISAGQPLRFEVAFNTHQGDLNFDLIKQAILFDDKGNKYEPLEWQGETGGHHLSGTLVFPPIFDSDKQMILKILDVYGVKERTFEWDLSDLK